ncbi:26S proteasome non-ATPase regulatory subunit 1 [Nosema bombycis CQ1]|uniref:26S proteasome non-ATPase regulatory subunit 1 n=1 Tax=Nosema bombycis (strain CQ1 / CVCC 102059) TaxID=578461 RepID=R0MF36_NOSB1|nr:26S proteasome non-ATPase regulatory subunit 1 [Nosema bombycis CQ1]|eukprot:EOB11358.1 26S proteasome non-ATPase regulatory subunit 1 [Nosema bombycis CQ1]
MESLKIIPNIKSLLENNREEDAVEIINKYIDSIAYYLKDILPQFKANTESSSLCLSKIYLILQNYEKSIEFAVKSGSLFKNDGSFYFKTLVNHMMDFLIKDNQHPCRKFIIEMIQKDVLSDSYIGYLYTIKEYEKFKFFFKIYLESYDRPKEFIKFIMKSAEENNDKERIYKVIYKMYCDNKGSDELGKEDGNDNGKCGNGKDEGSNELGNEEAPISIIPTNNLTTNTSFTLFRSHTIVYFLMDSLVFLKEFNEIKNILIRLEKKNPPACYDLCFYLEDNYKIKLGNIDAFGKNIPLILKGDFKRDLLQRFLTSNNLTSFRFLDSIAKTRSPHIGFVNALMNLGSTNDTFYRSNSDLLSSSKDWSKFNDVAYLGMIHLNNNLPYEVLKNYLPSESNNKEGGALYALGLINRKTYNEEDNEFLLYFLETIINEKSVNGSSCMELALGTCFGLGLINMGSNNENLIQKLLTLSKTDNTIISESAVYGLGVNSH